MHLGSSSLLRGITLFPALAGGSESIRARKLLSTLSGSSLLALPSVACWASPLQHCHHLQGMLNFTPSNLYSHEVFVPEPRSSACMCLTQHLSSFVLHRVVINWFLAHSVLAG